MPRKIDYPRASFRSALELAQAVQSLGGKTTSEVCAEKLGRSVGSGGFNSVVGAAVKFGLIKQTKGYLESLPIVKSIKLAYDDDERSRHYAEAFLTPPVFRSLANRFSGEKLPIEVLAKMLAKEFDVDMNASSAIAKQFIDGARLSGILDANNEVVKLAGPDTDSSKVLDVQVEEVHQLRLPSYYDDDHRNSTSNSIQDVQKENYEIVVPDSDKRKIPISLPGKRVAELSVPTDYTAKDLEVIKMQLDVLRFSIED
jgi:hypothetical protein